MELIMLRNVQSYDTCWWNQILLSELERSSQIGYTKTALHFIWHATSKFQGTVQKTGHVFFSFEISIKMSEPAHLQKMIVGEKAQM